MIRLPLHSRRGALALTGVSGNSAIVQSAAASVLDPSASASFAWVPSSARVWTTVLRSVAATDGVGVGFVDCYVDGVLDTDYGAGQVTAGAKPTYETAGPNGNPSIICDGGDELLGGTALGITGDAAFEMLILCKPTSSAALMFPFAFGGAGSLQGCSLAYNVTGAYSRHVFFNDGRYCTFGDATASTWEAVRIRKNAGRYDQNTFLWVNGVSVADAASTANETPNITDTIPQLCSFASFAFTGEIAGVWVWDAPLDDGDAALIDAWSVAYLGV